MLLGLPVRRVTRLAVAGLAAAVLFVALMVAVSFVSGATLPGCTGDSCLGSDQLFADLLAVPAVLLVALALTLWAFRIARPLLVALIATVVALVVLAVLAVASLSSTLMPATTVLLAVVALSLGPVAVVAAGTAVGGRGAPRFVLVAAVPLLTAAGVGLAVVAGAHQQQSRIRSVVPQPYGLAASTDHPGTGPATGEGMHLVSLDLNSTTRTLDLQYRTGDGTVYLRQTRPPAGAALAGRCAPVLSSYDGPGTVCTAVRASAPDLAVWRTGADNSLGEVVVVRAGAIVELTIDGAVTTDEAAHALVGRLVVADPGELVRQAEHSYVPDPGRP